MPIEVDAAERLDRIAEATLELAEREGPGAITIRAVAAELGGSTTIVTNYIKTRSDLLLNAVRFVQRVWNADSDAAVAAADDDPESNLKALVGWSTSTIPLDKAARQIWLDLVSRAPDNGASTLLREDAAEHHERFRQLVNELTGGNSDEVADAVYLAVRGFYFATTEDPDRWTSGRANAAILAIVELLHA